MITKNENSTTETPSSQGGVIVSNHTEKKAFQKVVWDDPTACCNNQDLYSHGNREWCKSCGHVFNY